MSTPTVSPAGATQSEESTRAFLTSVTTLSAHEALTLAVEQARYTESIGEERAVALGDSLAFAFQVTCTVLDNAGAGEQLDALLDAFATALESSPAFRAKGITFTTADGGTGTIDGDAWLDILGVVEGIMGARLMSIVGGKHIGLAAYNLLRTGRFPAED